MSFANRLKELRQRAGLTQQEVARRLGMQTGQSVSEWERGNSRPDQARLVAIAELYAVNVAWLLSNTGPKEKLSTETKHATPISVDARAVPHTIEHTGGKEDMTISLKTIIDAFNRLSPEGQQELLHDALALVGRESLATHFRAGHRA